MDIKIKNLLLKYLNDECTDEEIEEIRHIFLDGKYQEEWKQALEEDAVHQMDQKPLGRMDKENVDSLYQKILIKTQVKPKSRLIYAYWWKAVAAVLVMGVMGYFIFNNVFYNPQTMVEVSTLTGERIKIMLPDSSTIWLNDESKLSYSEKFEGDTRDVYLEGKAFFEVKENKEKPFLVHSGTLVIKVLGTSFDIKAYKDDKDIAVTVATGKVSVIRDKVALPYRTLLAGDQLAYDKEAKEFMEQKIEVDDILAWKEGRLIFVDETVGDIARSLERRYDIKFVFVNPADKNQRVTFKQKGSNLKDVLQIFSLVAGLEYQEVGNRIEMK
ncbi:FecR family protein [Anditalea andensis]|uniref:FecR family protein n=1 Tax=Anditalea andensis TaxID=1048983 RepID=UPI000A7893C7|nr:FecR domain-containing protein [Anditalea andensis]